MKLLFVDLDETLLNTDKTISEENLKAIELMTEAGHGFIINTGRATQSALKLANKYGLNKPGYYISSYNGSGIIKADTLEEIYAANVDEECARLIFDEAKKAGIHVQTYSDKEVIASAVCDTLLNYCKAVDLDYVITDDPVSFVGGKVPKVICASYGEHEKLVSFKEKMEPLIEGRLYSLFSNPALLEFGNVNASKGAAIDTMAGILGVDIKDTIGVGDEENDIDMIKHAGIGIAMCNGKESVKQVADVITRCDNNHSAIKEVIEQFIL